MTTPTPASVPDALYHRDGDGFVATAATQSAWDAGAQNGGAILGLLGRCLGDIPR